MTTVLTTLALNVLGGILTEALKRLFNQAKNMTKKLTTQKETAPETTDEPSTETRTETPDTAGTDSAETPETKEPETTETVDNSDTAGNVPADESAGSDEVKKPDEYPYAPCPECKSTDVSRLAAPMVTNYRNIQRIVKQTTKCKKCGHVYLSRVSVPLKEKSKPSNS